MLWFLGRHLDALALGLSVVALVWSLVNFVRTMRDGR